MGLFTDSELANISRLNERDRNYSPGPSSGGGFMDPRTAAGSSSSYSGGNNPFILGGGIPNSSGGAYGNINTPGMARGGTTVRDPNDNGMMFPRKPNGRGPGGVVDAEGGWADGVYYPPLSQNQPAQNNQQSFDPAKMLADALAKQKAELQSGFQSQQAQQQAAQKSAEEARMAAEQAAAAKKQGYINTQTPMYDQYFNQQQNSSLAALRNAREQAQQGFNSSERMAQQTAYNNSNQVDAQHTQSAQRLKEIMAANGLLSSGDNVTQNLQLENQRQNALYDINQSTGNVLQDVAQKRNLVNNQAASQEQSLTDKIGADKTKSLIDLQQYGDQKETDLNKFNYQQYVDSINNSFRQDQAGIQNKLSEANLTGQYNGNQTLASANSARQDALARAGLTGTLDGQQTLAGQNQSWGRQMDMANLTGQLGNGAKTLAAQQLDRQNKNDNISLAQWLTQTYGGQFDPKSDAGVAFDQTKGMQTLSQQQMGMQGRQANLDAALKLGQQDGRIYDPKSDWGLIRNPDAPLNLAGKTQASEEAYQQGMIRFRDAEAARQYALANGQIGTARQGNNIAQQRLDMEKGARGIEGEVYTHAQDFNSAQDVNDYFKANGSYLSKNLGTDVVDKLKKSFLSPFSAENKTDTSSYEKAFSAAQRDADWGVLTADQKKSRIKQYQDIRTQ